MPADQDKRFAEKAREKGREVWVTHGFEGFRGGTFGNAGHNLYVSRSGVLQRVHQFDLTGNGCVDLVFPNSQGHWECPRRARVLWEVKCWRLKFRRASSDRSS